MRVSALIKLVMMVVTRGKETLKRSLFVTIDKMSERGEAIISQSLGCYFEHFTFLLYYQLPVSETKQL